MRNRSFVRLRFVEDSIMKKFLLLIYVSLFSYIGFAQQYANNWIQYSQKYYRIPITSEGIYKVTYNDLVSYGISVGDFDPRNLQIIHNGKVLPLFVSGESDFVFNVQDYFEFYAPGRNTGWLDTAMYMKNNPLNPDYSLYNDTASYFLTFANTLTSPRYDTTRNTNFSSYTAQSYCLRKVRQNFTAVYNSSAHAPYMYEGEGWCDNFFNMGASTDKTLSTPQYANVGQPYSLRFGFCGFSDTRHDIFVESPIGTPLFDTIYSGYNAVHKKLTLSNALTATTSIRFRSISGFGKAADKNSVAYVEITYPHTYNFESTNQFTFTVPAVPTGNFLLLEITNFDGGDAPILFCPETRKRIVATKSGSKYQVLLPNPYKEVTCIFANPDAFQKVPKIVTVKTKNSTGAASMFHDLSNAANQGNYVIITNQSLWTQANSYRAYRSNTGYSAVLIDVNEIYNQFGYGIQKHPMAIYNFIEYATKVWGIKAEYIFLIGKGYQLDYYRNNSSNYANTLIPGMGYPAADLLFTTDLQAKNTISKVAIGRLAAKTNSEVDYYKKKVEEHEKQTPAPWMKTVLHFGGGNTAAEKRLFKTYLQSYESSLEGEYFGAQVYTFLKESSDVFEKTEPEAIREHMNNGTSILNFFGHASGTGFDQNIDHPSLFNNQGKYPLIIANSCYSGDIFTTSTGINETWTLIPNRGSIGFIANVDLGSPTYLNIFTLPFINNTAKHNYGKSVGTSIQLTLQEINNKYGSVQEIKNSSLSFMLHGDPAIKVHSFQNPDLELKPASIFTNPSFVTNDLEEFTLNVVVYNNGRTTKDSCYLRVVLTPQSGEPYVINHLIQGLFLRDTFKFVLPIALFPAGNYSINAKIDDTNRIEEYDEMNNETTVDFFISSRDVLPVYPPNYAIIPQNNQLLTVSAVDPHNPPARIIIEIDTTASYSSPLKVSQTIQTNGRASIQWNPGITYIEHKVYFWRVTNADSIKWNEHSFVYEQGRNGWAQKHPHQFIENNLSFMNFNEQQNSYSYFTVPRVVTANNTGSLGYNVYPTNYLIDGVQYGSSGAGVDAIHIAVMDSISLIPWYSSQDNYGHYNYLTGVGARYFIFVTSNAVYRANMAKFIRDSIPKGNYILAFSYKDTRFSLWEEELRQVFDDLGATLHRTTPDSYPYILFTKKGDVSYTKETIGVSNMDYISQSSNVVSNYFEGTQKSTKIGPSNHFQEYVWNITTVPGEIATYTLKAISQQQDIYSAIKQSSNNHDRLDTLINAKLFPYLELENYTQDNLLRTPPHLNYWKVYYDPVGEIAVTPKHIFTLYNDTLQQGDTLRLNVSAQNVAYVNMDSVLILYEIRSVTNELIVAKYQRVAPALAQQYIYDQLSYSTKELSGTYTIRIEFNPINPNTGEYDQLENSRINNFLYTHFYVKTDKTKPILDVTIDNRHVSNGDYISSKPTILLRLYDENQYLLLQDTSVFSVKITNVLSGITTTYYFNGSNLRFVPATANNKTCYAIFSPEFTENGTYILSIEAKDMSNNLSGIEPYTIEFTIDLESKISVLYNFPNPCTDATTFRFILTGSKIPETMYIHIYANDGKLVHTIPVHTAKHIHIGTNSLEVYWNLTDAAGRRLSAGTYTYILRFSNQASYKHLKTVHDQVMNTKYGRLIIADY